jgi:hypothetical protein
MTINYYINGVTFESLKVKVSNSDGIMDGLKLKNPAKMDWPDHHGVVIDLSAPRYESREITLDCFIESTTPTAFILAVQAFIAAFQKPGLQRLMIDINDGVSTRKPLLYEVYLPDGVNISKVWNPEKNIGTFRIKLIEPEPVKRVYKFVATAGALSVTMTVTTVEPVNIYWGDGNNDLDVVTGTGQITHAFATAGTYYIVLTGIIENITGVTTTATLVWNKL